MEENYRYEAVVLGKNPASLFAGYILKRNRMRFRMVDVPEEVLSGTLEQDMKSRSVNSSELSEEGKLQVRRLLKKINAQVGISETDVLTEEGGHRLTVLLEAELEEERKNTGMLTGLMHEADRCILKCGDDLIETDAVIFNTDMAAAGDMAMMLLEEKQKRLEDYMGRLRIKAGKRTQRKLVYATHSRNWFYAREAITRYAVEQGAAVVNPFMNYGFYLNGAVKKDEVDECCHQLIRSADELWVFGPISEAILTDIVVAVMEGKHIRFFSISEQSSEIHELREEDISFEREVHAGKIKKADLLNFVRCSAPRTASYVQLSLFD